MGIIEDFNNHQLWEQIKSTKAVLDDSDSLSPETKLRIKRLLGELERRKDKTDPFLIPAAALDEMRNHIHYIHSYLSNGYHQNIPSYIEAALKTLANSWPSLSSKHQAFLSQKTAEEILESTRQHIQKVDASVDSINEAKETIRELKSQYQTAVNAAMASLDEQVAIVLNDYQEKIDKEVQAKTNSADSILSHLVEIEASVNKKANATAGRLIADEYGKYSRNKTLLAYVYDVIAISFAIAGLVVLWQTLIAIDASETSASIMKLAITLAVFTASGYIFRRGTLQHKEAIAAKRTDLTLRQYLPFISVLDNENRNDITIEIARRVFVKGEINNDDNKGFGGLFKKQDSNFGADELAKIISEAIKAVIKPGE